MQDQGAEHISQQGLNNVLNTQQHHHGAEVHPTGCWQHAPDRSQNRLGQALQEHANLPDQLVTAIEYAKRIQIDENTGYKENPAINLQYPRQHHEKRKHKHDKKPAPYDQPEGIPPLVIRLTIQLDRKIVSPVNHSLTKQAGL